MKCIEEDIPYDIPNTWAWCRIHSFISFTGGAQPPKSTFEYEATEKNIRLIQIRDYKTDAFMTFIPKELARRFCDETDVMIGRYGPPLFQILRGLKGAYNVALMKAETNNFLMSKDYLFYMLQDSELLRTLESVSDRTCGQDGINMYVLNNYLLPIPPMAQQQRIIHYLDIIVPKINTLSSDIDSLSELTELSKAKVLDLAVRGKLVPQDRRDEPASILLERIRAEKEELIKQGKLKRDKKESVIYKGDDNSYYGDLDLQIPKTWEVIALQEINTYCPVSVNPALNPETTYELYSVPIYESGYPEIIKGKEIGSTKQQIQMDDILISKINPRINRVWRNHKYTDYLTICSSEWIVFRNNNLYAPYMQIYFSSPFFRKYMLSNVSGVGGSLMRAQPKSVRKYPVIIPPYDEQKRIVTLCNSILEQLASIKLDIE